MKMLMRNTHVAIVGFALCVLAFFVVLFGTAHLLPDRVASHFNAAGQPDGWSTRAAYLTVSSFFGVGLPLFIIALSFVSRFLPDWMVNLPNKAFWLGAMQRDQTYSYVFIQSFWMGCLLTGLIAGAHLLTVQANRTSPVALNNTAFLSLLGCFLVGMAIWVVTFVRRFRRPSFQ